MIDDLFMEVNQTSESEFLASMKFAQYHHSYDSLSASYELKI